MLDKSTSNGVVPGYRFDIDGLRAIAVLSVVIFHINEWLTPGGFVGVDIFFVISGFLISQQLYKQISTNTFSLLEFYRRRVRRIVPAMLVVVAATMLLSQILFRPEDAEKVAESGIASVLSLANVYFWLFQDTGYFASSSLEVPLLHLWSLGIEEQFYVFWPLVLLLLKPALLGRGVFILLSIVALCSYALAESLFASDPSQTYYMLHTRAGELMVGALAAHWVFNNPSPERFKAISGPLRLLGYGLIAYSMVALSGHDVFPGWAALPPTLGAAFILVAGHIHQGKTAQPLKWQSLRFFGLISYSLYLWHWPLLAFWRYGNLPITLGTGIFLFAVMVGLSWITYHWVEQTMRHSKLPAWSTIMRYYAIPAVVLTVAGGAFMKLDGYGYRAFIGDYSAELSETRSDIEAANHHERVCQYSTLPLDPEEMAHCVLSAKEQTSTAFMFGDSNASHYVGVLTPTLNKQGVSVVNRSLSACPPLKENSGKYASNKRKSDCEEGMPRIWDEAKEYERLIISASWVSYEERASDFVDDFFKQLSPLIEDNKEILLVGKMPVFDDYDRYCREKTLSMPWLSCEVEDIEIGEDVRTINAQLKGFSERYENVNYVDIYTTICPNGVCSIYSDHDDVLYYDRSHLSRKASWSIGESLADNDSLLLFTD